MSDSISFALTGVDELINTLKTVTHETKRKGGRAALRKAAQVVVNSAKKTVATIDDPSTGRKIADNIAMRWNGKLYKQTGDLSFRVGVLTGNIRQALRGNPDDGGKTPHAFLVELGTERSKAQPYLRPALANNIDLATSTFISEYGKAIDRAISRAAKKGTTA